MDHNNVTDMKSTTVRGLRHDTRKVLAWVAAGESVEVRPRRQPVAVVVPPRRKGRIVRPDFRGRLRTICGDTVLPTTGTDVVREARGET
jgi:antitoxin (DNA-binding transcriptional repressor) of toxin-antitoxin stability system